VLEYSNSVYLATALCCCKWLLALLPALKRIIL